MIMSMCKVICVTNRHLVRGDFLTQLEKIVFAGADGVILREKDLMETDYMRLAEKAAAVCGKYGVPLMAHTYIEAARQLGISNIHLPFHLFRQMNEEQKRQFTMIGVSVHSTEEAGIAEKESASYVTAGHVFPTDCKKGLAPRGLKFLAEVCGAVRIPVYAIGGVTQENGADCIRAGAAGVCLMSSLMMAAEPGKLMEQLRV